MLKNKLKLLLKTLKNKKDYYEHLHNVFIYYANVLEIDTNLLNSNPAINGGHTFKQVKKFLTFYNFQYERVKKIIETLK